MSFLPQFPYPFFLPLLICFQFLMLITVNFKIFFKGTLCPCPSIIVYNSFLLVISIMGNAMKCSNDVLLGDKYYYLVLFKCLFYTRKYVIEMQLEYAFNQKGVITIYSAYENTTMTYFLLYSSCLQIFFAIFASELKNLFGVEKICLNGYLYKQCICVMIRI